MSSADLIPPQDNELEVSLFGPGFGESVVIHTGDGKWIVVDSCMHPDVALPAALDYLWQLKVDVSKAVKLVVATHWHDDHVRGISGIFNACQSAELVISGALQVDEFFKLVSLYQGRQVAKSSGVDEFSKLFELLQTRKPRKVRFNPPIFASADKLLYRDDLIFENAVHPIRVYALSPSDTTILQSKIAFGKILPQSGENQRRVSAPTPNFSSTALWIELGSHALLLGADLEETVDPKTGWSVILTESKVISGIADIFKVPHHGSENAHHQDVWTQLLATDPHAILTPFARGRKPLPSVDDIARIVNLTPNASMTSPARLSRERWRNRVVRDFVNDVTREMISVNHGWGQIRLRRRLTGGSAAPWELTLLGDAHRLNDYD